MAPSHPTIPTLPGPRREVFDPWNSASTGHQRAENRLSGSTSWRDSRSYKLSHQFRDNSGRGGAGHRADLVGAGSAHYGQDGRMDNGDWEKGAPGLREKGWQDIRSLMSGVSKKRPSPSVDDVDRKSRKTTAEEPADHGKHEASGMPDGGQGDQQVGDVQSSSVESDTAVVVDGPLNSVPHLFSGLNMYINGSTAPTVGDHKLKQLLAAHGANVAIALGRRTVTHVILGSPNGQDHVLGAGGGLAATKIQKEIRRVHGKGVKFVGVEWVLESIKAGKRLPEARFANLHTAPRGQRTIHGLFKDSNTRSLKP